MMSLTITEKILLAHTNSVRNTELLLESKISNGAKKKSISPGEFIWARVDLVLGNDITSPIAINEFKKLGRKQVFDHERIVLIPDHFLPAKDIKSAGQAKLLKDFAKRHKIRHFYEVGRMGIEHALLPELGLVLPGDLIIGADSHTCTHGALGAFATGIGSTDLAAAFATGRCWLKVPETIRFIYYGKLKKWVGGKDIILYTIGNIGVDGASYKAMEFGGETIRNLAMDDRFTICNMAIEAGAKSGIIEPDEIAFEYISKNHPDTFGVGTKFKNLKSDNDAHYIQIKEYDVSKLEPQVACPHSPGNVKPISKVGKVKIDQVVIGSCTNGRISDLRIAAKILKDKKIHPNLRLIVIPATQKIYLEAIKEGLVEIFVEAGGVFSTPTCGPCLGGHMGILAKGERALATTNRNFIGRMGHPESEVYLCNPAVAAASAVKGTITHPDDI